MSVTSCFYNLLKETVGVVPRDGSGKVDPAAAKLRNLDSTILDAAYSAVPEIALLENPHDSAESATEIVAFEARLRARSRGLPPDSVHRKLGLAWSTCAEPLRELIRLEKKSIGPSKFTERSFITGHFKDLKLVNMGLTDMDPALSTFSGLRELNVSGNKVACVQHLPPGLVSLCAYANNVRRVEPGPSGGVDTLVHLGLGYNAVEDEALYGIARLGPNVEVLDVSWNGLTDLGNCLRTLDRLSSLRHLVLMGNPCALTYGYRSMVASQLPLLQTLDDTLIGAAAAAADSSSGPAGAGAGAGVGGAGAGGASPHPESSDEAGSGAPAPEPGSAILLLLRASSCTGLVVATDVVPKKVEAVPEAGTKGAKAAAPAGKKGKEVVEEAPPPPPAPASTVHVVVRVCPDDGAGHVSASSPAGAVCALDEGAALSPRTLPPTLETRDILQYSKAEVLVYERIAAKSGEGGEPASEEREVVVGKGAISLSALLAPTTESRVVVDTSCEITCVELLHETLAAVRQAARDKVLAPPAEAEPAPAPSGKAPAKGKGAAAEVPAPVVARELTPEEAATVDADVAATRKRLLASTTCSVRVEVVLVLEGPL